jgi:hypothetical protein
MTFTWLNNVRLLLLSIVFRSNFRNFRQNPSSLKRNENNRRRQKYKILIAKVLLNFSTLYISTSHWQAIRCETTMSMMMTMMIHLWINPFIKAYWSNDLLHSHHLRFIEISIDVESQWLFKRSGKRRFPNQGSIEPHQVSYFLRRPDVKINTLQSGEAIMESSCFSQNFKWW